MGLNFDGVNPDVKAKLEGIVKDGKITESEMQGLTKAEKEALAKAFGGELPPIGDIFITPAKVEAKETPKKEEKPGFWQKAKNWVKENPAGAFALGALGVGAAILAAPYVGVAALGGAVAGAIGKGLLAIGAVASLTSCGEGFNNIDIDQNVNIKIDYKNDKIEDIYNQLVLQGESINKIVDLLIENGRKPGESLELLTKINIEESKQTEILEKLVGNNDAAMDYLKDILDAEKDGNKISAGNQELLNQILDKLKVCEDDGAKDTLNKILGLLQQSITQNKEMVEKTHALLEQLIKLVNKNGSDANALGKEILNYIAAVGFEMNRNFSAVLEAINKGAEGSDGIRALLEKVIKNQGENTKAIIEAMGNIKLDGDNIDLSGLEAMVKELLEQSKKNGDTLTSIDGKMDVVNVTTKAILAKLEDDGIKNDTRYNNIIKILTAIKDKANSIDEGKLLDKLDKILDNLDKILAAIKDHDVNVTVDLTGKVVCTCKCENKNHEGIDQLNELLK